MLLAAMILGLIGGIMYFVGGGAAVIAPQGSPLVSGVPSGFDSVQWWMIVLIVIGVVAVLGGALARVNPGLAGTILLLAAAAAICVGFASFEDAVEAGPLNLALTFPTHPFSGPFIYLPVPLISLVVGGALALSAGKRPGTN